MKYSFVNSRRASRKKSYRIRRFKHIHKISQREQHYHSPSYVSEPLPETQQLQEKLSSQGAQKLFALFRGLCHKTPHPEKGYSICLQLFRRYQLKKASPIAKTHAIIIASVIFMLYSKMYEKHEYMMTPKELSKICDNLIPVNSWVAMESAILKTLDYDLNVDLDSPYSTAYLEFMMARDTEHQISPEQQLPWNW